LIHAAGPESVKGSLQAGVLLTGARSEQSSIDIAKALTEYGRADLAAVLDTPPRAVEALPGQSSCAPSGKRQQLRPR
jgi:hypothetical protein